jgi:membrane protein implicated in regulation of membrane protease activity
MESMEIQFMSAHERKKPRRELVSFILFSVIEEAAIAAIAYILILFFLPELLLPGMIIVGIGLIVFSLAKIYFFTTSSRIPIEDPILHQIAEALIDFKQDEDSFWQGRVKVRGETWRAKSPTKIMKGETAMVQKIDGLYVIIEKNKSPKET